MHPLNSTEDLAGDGQECNSSPVVTYVKVAFLRELYNESFSPVTWDSLFVPNGLKQLSQDSGSSSEIGLQHFRMNDVYAWSFSTLHSFDGVFDFRFCSGSGVDVEIVWCWCGFIWLVVIQDFTEVLNPCVGLFTFGCNSLAIFAFHRTQVIIITTETFGDLIDSALFTSCCITLSFCC